MQHVSVLFAALALSVACDSSDPATTAQPEEVADAELSDDDALAQPEGHEHHRHRGGEHERSNPAQRLCEDLGCTDAQAKQIAAVFEGRSPPPRDGGEHEAANEALAAAFRGSSFSSADIEAYFAAAADGDERMARHVETMEELHTILTAEQRSALAARLESGEMMGPKGRGKHGKRKGNDADGRGDHRAKSVEHRVERLCEPLSCTADQRQKLTAIVGQAKADRPERDEEQREAGRKAIAEAMRSETFDAGAVRAQLEQGKGKPAEHRAHKADTAVAIHGVLNAEQRGQVADRIAEHGPAGVMGHRGRPGKHRGKHREGKRGEHRRGPSTRSRG